MIRQVNKNEVDLGTPGDSSTTPPYTLAAAATRQRWKAPADGTLEAVILMVAVAPGAGGTAHTQGVKVDKRGITGAVSAVTIADEFLLKNTTPVSAVGDVIKLIGNSNNSLLFGEIFEFVDTEGGTPGGTDPQYTIVQVIFRARDHLDGQRHPGV